jgi:hypothetical protein
VAGDLAISDAATADFQPPDDVAASQGVWPEAEKFQLPACHPLSLGQFFVMLLVPDITAGTGTESDETPGWWWPVGLSQSEGAHERVVSVYGSRAGCPTIWGLADARSTLRCQQVA